MKKVTLFLFAIFTYSGIAQDLTSQGGAFIFNETKSPCLTEEARSLIISDIQASVADLEATNRLAFGLENRGGNVLFNWPVEKTDGFTYNKVWGISNYVDHNANFPDQIQDYNCGTRSYDLSSGYNHSGVDIFTWPFGWRQMDNDEAVIKAAAPGQIIFKHDGEFDRNCAIAGTLTWNAVYIQHADGTVTWYGHMKNGSVTTKAVGEMVSDGEVIGVVGSSGYSTGPHLHMETWSDNTYTNLIDPYSGPCNPLNANTKWQSQKPYWEPRINAVLTHSNPPVFNTCPNQETTNESNQFGINDPIVFAIYLGDQQAGTSINLKVVRPNNTVLYDWDFALTDTFSASYWYWTFNTLNIEGEWKWEATYGGETITHRFNLGTLSIEEQTLESVQLFPNPFNDVLRINSNITINSIQVTDVLGKTVLTRLGSNQTINQINTSNLSKGVYFVTLRNTENALTRTVKMIKE
ncbi:peptidoglycan DD-metalloendopeptidase family protein [Ichthyenterobacterium sp. W332]|uniref:Peptidoglycan DD-metalloendopeptidase family protein n=1 Tax=Microcosmobacter mediterraneus TaxID=3075607 RepID=A0ABU2YIW3_9FLAO|nr:peptidoglycan DD-metalloendopeptidase family protein [Ichthyenterobacterium sp. W332]MDT0558114.1 peptidoglycan DD-metalloendopeptidase family protein [Ichthyenterobacterium sp. W332]